MGPPRRHQAAKRTVVRYKDGKGTGGLGTLKLADFGQAELNSEWSRSKHRKDLAHPITYRAPEFDIKPYITRASYDLWSLGCMYSEFVAWAIGGPDSVDSFAQSRKSDDKLMAEVTDVFFEVIERPGEEEAELKPQVKEASPTSPVSPRRRKPSTKELVILTSTSLSQNSENTRIVPITCTTFSLSSRVRCWSWILESAAHVRKCKTSC
ncbi:hypothetical protein BR93DRAFT_928328 [Coniochaeta sp. PMI_546]|nr:hypothetical protein BR93DRAFT_928328 [Coniochaeta sp. PMI_546]